MGEAAVLNGPEQIRVVIADDHALVRAGLASVLEAEPDIVVVGEAETGTEAVDLVTRLSPEVLLLDLRMPEMDGVAVCSKLAEADAATRVLVLSSFDDDEDVFGALQAGASGYILKDVKPEVLAQTIRGVADGQTVLAKSIAPRVLGGGTGGQRARAVLSEREQQVLELMARGFKNRDIAREMWISESTVKTHVGSVIRKLGQRDRTQAVLDAMRRGLVHLDDGA